MRTITKRELNQHTAQVLDAVTTGEDVVVTERQPALASDRPLDSLGRQGLYSPPSAKPRAWPARPGGPSYNSEQLDAIIGEMKGER
jgi:hypothetical protein